MNLICESEKMDDYLLEINEANYPHLRPMILSCNPFSNLNESRILYKKLHRFTPLDKTSSKGFL